jgi:hypothetical protein
VRFVFCLTSGQAQANHHRLRAAVFLADFLRLAFFDRVELFMPSALPTGFTRYSSAVLATPLVAFLIAFVTFVIAPALLLVGIMISLMVNLETRQQKVQTKCQNGQMLGHASAAGGKPAISLYRFGSR